MKDYNGLQNVCTADSKCLHSWCQRDSAITVWDLTTTFTNLNSSRADKLFSTGVSIVLRQRQSSITRACFYLGGLLSDRIGMWSVFVATTSVVGSLWSSRQWRLWTLVHVGITERVCGRTFRYINKYRCEHGSRGSSFEERWTRDRKVASSNPGRRTFFSRVNSVCRFLFGVRSTLALLQWRVKDPSHSTKKQVAGYT